MKLTPKQSELAPKALTFIRDDFARQDAAELQHWGKHLHAGSGVSNIAVGEHLGTGKKDTWSLLSKLVSAGLLRVASSHTGTGEQRRGWAGGGAANFHKEHWNYTQVTYTVEHYRITPEGEAWLAVSARSNPARMTTAEALDALRDATTGEEVEAIADAYAEGEKHRHWSDQDNATIIDRHAGIWYLTPPREDDNGVMQKARRSCCEKGSPSIDMGREYMLPPMTVERSIRLRNLLSQAAFDREHAQANPGASAPTEVQSLLFRRELWTPQRAEAWLRQHNFPGIDLDEKPNTLRYRQADPDLYWPGSFRTIPFGSASGIQAVVGKRKRGARANPPKSFDVGSREFHVSSSIADNIAETMQHDPYAWYSAIDAVAASEDTARELWLDRGGNSAAFYRAWPAIRDAAEKGLHFPTPPELPSPERVRELRFPRPAWRYGEPTAWARNYGFGHFALSTSPDAYVLKHPKPGTIEEGETTELDESTLPRSRKIQALVGWPKIKRPRHSTGRTKLRGEAQAQPTAQSEFISLFRVRDAFAGRERLSKDILEEVAWELGYEGEPWSAIARFEPLATSYGADLRGAHARGAAEAPRANSRADRNMETRTVTIHGAEVMQYHVKTEAHRQELLDMIEGARHALERQKDRDPSYRRRLGFCNDMAAVVRLSPLPFWVNALSEWSQPFKTWYSPEKQAASSAKPRRNPSPLAHLDGTPYFSPAALQHALDEAGPRSRTTIVAMSPDDFIRLAEKGYDRDKASTVQALVRQGTQFTDVPFLLFRNLGEDALVTGHEGRHRAMALRAEGVKLMPVRLVSQEYKAIPIRWSQWQDGPELGDVWPKRLWAEDTSEADIKRGRTKGASCPFPDSLIYPRRQP